MSDFEFSFTSLDLFSNGNGGISSQQQQQQQQQQTDNRDQQLIKIDNNAPELVLLVGPPCSGRTFYYYQHYRSTHIRISATELFQKDRELSFRSIIQNRVLRALQEGKSVVIDDTNHMKSIRESYIQALIKSETPVSRIVCYNFIPSGGELQIQWALSWAYSERSMVESVGQSQFKSLDYVQFKAEYQTPLKREGYNMLKDLTTPLFFNQHSDEQEKELSNIALFLDSRTLIAFVDRSNQSPFKLPAGTLKFKYAVQLIASADATIKQWISNYPKNGPNGQHRIIMLIDEVSLFPASIDYTDQITVEYYRKELKKVIKQLSDSICYPVYYYYVPALQPGNEFYRFPNLGLFAIAQYRHRLSLQKSIVVVDDADPKLATSIPFKVILSSKFFQDSTWSIESKISKNLLDNVVNIPSFLESVQFVNYDDIDGFVPERGLPMFSKALMRKNEKTTTEELLPSGKRHGVYIPQEDKVQSDHQQDQIDSDQVVFDFDFETDDTNDNDNGQNTSTKATTESNFDENSKPLPWVDNRFMVEFGIDSQSVYRGDSYYREARLSNVELSHSEPDYSSPSIAVRAQCKGTSPQPYSLLIRYRMKGNRKLPEWMAPGKPTTSHSEYKKVSPQKKTLNLYFPENEVSNSGRQVTPKKHGKASLTEPLDSSPVKKQTSTTINSDLFIQQLFGNQRKSYINDNSSNNSGDDDSNNKANQNSMLAMDTTNGSDEFCVPRTNSEEFLRSVIQKEFNNTHEPVQSFSLMSSQDDNTTTTTTTSTSTTTSSSPTTKKKISLKQILESQGFQIDIPSSLSTSSPPPPPATN
ncbi:hypothetical protein PPL_08707 [Heterostelium album PN500]|uniref:Uncharacterized protein n=1 Tax=Heterostelium pallidum (strain ATCC 26659 / Pp 5 / PN500) TaxID=670386 RepID=D3BJI1_HETP5|nr:hypothetical protein PPL_08707 [Heterostelium album PN500]EFA78061.1 hypothetical protein PPL_08707 [Heterostelium album PN500]|eukprot:XP_020430188.1 hypothetical protein PPL_08707 [Heterostelium album PN500]